MAWVSVSFGSVGESARTIIALITFVSLLAPLAGAGYLLLLTVASLTVRYRKAPSSSPTTRFALLIPAHDEELVIGRLLNSIQQLDYPRDRFATYVVADHCGDETAAIARRQGMAVFERAAPDLPGKARSINWLADWLLASEATEGRFDAFVVIDADSQVATDFLREMDVAVRSGAAIIQSRVEVDNPVDSWVSGLRTIAYGCISYLRPLGRSALGLSVGLRGNGVCMTHEIAQTYRWNPESLTEDYELHSRLLLAGHRVALASRARVLTQMPTTLTSARSQNVRWERGRLAVWRAFGAPLVRAGLRRRSWVPIDGAIELAIPPFSILVATLLVALGAGLLLRTGLIVALALCGLGAVGAYLWRGLLLAPTRSPKIYLALLGAPLFLLWKIPVYLVAALRQGRGNWVRTARIPGE